MEVYKYYIGKEQYISFQLINDLTLPCPICYAPACGKEEILWYKDKGKYFALVYDANVLTSILSQYFKHNITPDNYASTTQFIRDWSECTGWEDDMSVEGYLLDLDDFINTLELLGSDLAKRPIEALKMKLFREMESIALRVRELGGGLRLIRA